jgi:hypothetical protein
MQVRVYEKARDDYAKRFNDAGLPEACVADMLRGRAVCETGGQLLALQELLGNSFSIRVQGEGDQVREVEKGGELVTLELVRTKNKCSSKAVGAHECGLHLSHFLRWHEELLMSNLCCVLTLVAIVFRPDALSELPQ